VPPVGLEPTHLPGYRFPKPVRLPIPPRRPNQILLLAEVICTALADAWAESVKRCEPWFESSTTRVLGGRWLTMTSLATRAD
jgi:hypothetical protein